MVDTPPVAIQNLMTDLGYFSAFMHGAASDPPIDLGDGGTLLPTLRASQAAVGASVSDEIASILTEQATLQTIITAISVGIPVAKVFYALKATMTADHGQADQTIAMVYNDAGNNGLYFYTVAGTVWTTVSNTNAAAIAAEIARAEAAEAALSARIAPLESAVATIAGTGGDGILASQLGFDCAGATMIPWVVDCNLNVVFGFDVVQRNVYIALAASAIQPVLELLMAPLNAMLLSYDGPVGGAPLALDANLRAVLAMTEDGGELDTAPSAGTYDATPLTPLVSLFPGKTWPKPDYYHILWVGQSEATGHDGVPPINTAAIYNSVMFQGGLNTGYRPPSGGVVFASFVPLIENVTFSQDGVAGAVPVETGMSVAAKFFNQLVTVEDGGHPTDWTILCSTGSKGGQTVGNFNTDGTSSAPTQQQITAAITVAGGLGKTVGCYAVTDVFGETDVLSNTNYATMVAARTAEQGLIEGWVHAAYGGTTPVILLLRQTAALVRYDASINPAGYDRAANPAGAAVQRAQHDMQLGNPRFACIGGMFHLPHNSGGTHLTNVGYDIMGAEEGRAQWQIAKRQCYPAQIRATSVTIRGTQLRAKFAVPRKPLRFDPDYVFASDQCGLALSDDAGAIALTNLAIIGGDTVVATMGRATSTGAHPSFRSGLDELHLSGDAHLGASNGLVDSTPDTILIQGVYYSLAFRAPIFMTTPTVLE